MKRVLVLGSHHSLADGLKDTLEFVSPCACEVVALSAYMDNQPVDEAVTSLMDGFDADDEVVVLTDMAAGSVNQKFFPYGARPHTHIVGGMNLPLAFLVAMEPRGGYISRERMREMVDEARAEIRYVADIEGKGDDEDE